MKSIIIAFVKIYKITISPLLPNSCRHQPSCSSYAIDSLNKHGVIKGALRAAWRILRCNPWGRGGHDPA